MENSLKNSGKNKIKLRIIYPKYHENFKSSMSRVQFTGSYIKTSASKLNLLITKSTKNPKHSYKKKEFMRQPIALYASCNN